MARCPVVAFAVMPWAGGDVGSEALQTPRVGRPSTRPRWQPRCCCARRAAPDGADNVPHQWRVCHPRVHVVYRPFILAAEARLVPSPRAFGSSCSPPPPLACVSDSCGGGCGLVSSTGGSGRDALGDSLLPGAVERSSPGCGWPMTGAVPLQWRGPSGPRRGLGGGPPVGVPRRDGMLGQCPAAPPLQCVPAPRGHPPARRCRSRPSWLCRSGRGCTA